MLASVRAFFASSGTLEVDCPLCSAFASVDTHIDLIEVALESGERRYLHSSPEYGMKRLLAEGIGDLYQLSHVFRAGEIGRRHNPEFTMIEWYRCGIALESLIAESVELLSLFLGKEKPYRKLTYRQAVEERCGIDCMVVSDAELLICLNDYGVTPSPALCQSRDDLLNLIMGQLVEPHFAEGEITAIVDYPASQSALAEIEEQNGTTVARRFELYYGSCELANGYQELRDGRELRKRFERANRERQALGKRELPIDERLLEALPLMPPCCGVAIGFDRLMMVRHDSSSLAELLSFTWDNA